MKRSTPLKRTAEMPRTPFVRGDGPHRNTGQPDGMYRQERRAMRRQGFHVPAAIPKRKRPKSTNAPKAVEAMAWTRATVDGVLSCEMCARPLIGFRGRDFSLQHRPRRGNGGAANNPLVNQASALIAVCGHALSGCHFKADNDTDRYVNGWQVRRDGDDRPEDVPVLLQLHGGWVLLDNLGGRTPVDVADGAA